MNKKNIIGKSYTLGSWIQIGDPDFTRMMANSGFEFLVIDMEHGYKVTMVETAYQTLAVDTLEDLKVVVEKINHLFTNNIIKYFISHNN